MVLDFNNNTYDNKRKFTGNEERKFTGNEERKFTGNEERKFTGGLSHTKTANKYPNMKNHIVPLKSICPPVERTPHVTDHPSRCSFHRFCVFVFQKLSLHLRV